jgi:very-short-patch-repair endonuclease
LDVMLGHGYVEKDTLLSWASAYPRSQAARAIALADGRAESPQETRARVKLVLAGFPPPVPQFEVRVDGQFVARLDLAWPEARVAVEYDGVWHAGPRQLTLDRLRTNRLLDAGWRVYSLTAGDLKDPVRFARFSAQLQKALALA